MKGARREIPWVIRDGSGAIRARVVPDLVAPFALAFQDTAQVTELSAELDVRQAERRSRLESER